MHLFSSRLVCVIVVLVTVGMIAENPVSAGKIKRQELKDKKSPTGGYRTTLETQESMAREQFTQDQFPPAVRSPAHYTAAPSSHSSLEETEAVDDQKGPLTFRIQDRTPWRPMVSETTASHRIHKTTFAKGFKFHSFADEKHVSGLPLRSSIGDSHSYSDTGSGAHEQATHFLVPSSHQHRQRGTEYEPHVQHGEPHAAADRRPRQQYLQHIQGGQKQELVHPDHFQQVAYQVAPHHRQQQQQQQPQYTVEHHFRGHTEPATISTSSHSAKNTVRQQHLQQVLHSGTNQHQHHHDHHQRYHQSTRQQYQQQQQAQQQQQQQPTGHDQVQYVYVDAPQAVRGSKEVSSTEQVTSGRHVQLPVHLAQQQHQQQHQYVSYGVPIQYTSQNSQQQQHSTGKEEEEPSDDVLLAHIPLPKSKIAVEVDDIDDVQSHSGHNGPATVPGRKSQHATHDSGPIYRVIDSPDNKEISVGSDAQSLEYDFKQHFKHSDSDGRSNLQDATYRSITPPRSQSPRKGRQFTVRASPIAPRTDHRLYSQAQAYIMPQQHSLHQAFLQTPAGLQTSFRKATLHRTPAGLPKSLSYMPVMITYDGRAHNNAAQAAALIAQDTTDKRLHHRPSYLRSVVPHRGGYLGGFGFPEQAVTRVPSLTRDIQTYIKKKAA